MKPKILLLLLLFIYLLSGCKTDNSNIVPTSTSEPITEDSKEYTNNGLTLDPITTSKDPASETSKTDPINTPATLVLNKSIVFGFVHDKSFTNETTIQNKNAASYINKDCIFRFYNLSGQIGTGTNPAYIVTDEVVQGANDTIEIDIDIQSHNKNDKNDLRCREIGLCAAWEPMPRIPIVQLNEIVLYNDIIKSLLEEKDFDGVDVKINQVLRIDLDGNGTEEVIITASNHSPNMHSLEEGSKYYSIVLLRKIVGNSVENIVLKENYALNTQQDSYGKVHTYNVPFIIDANGDGDMEIFIEDRPNGPWFTIEIIKLIDKNKPSVIYTFGLGG